MNRTRNIDSYNRQFILVNENKFRLTAVAVLILAIIYLATGEWIFPALLIVDYAIRSFSSGEYSMLNILSDNLVNIFNIDIKPVDYAPRQFAARLGLVISVMMFITAMLNFSGAAIVLTVLLALLTLSDAVLGFCPACYVYKTYKKQSLKMNCL